MPEFDSAGSDSAARDPLSTGADETRRGLVQVQVIAGALTFSVPLYAGILWALTSGVVGDPVVLDQPVWIAWLLIGLGVLALLVAPGAERRMMAAPAAPPVPDETGGGLEGGGLDAGGRMEAEGRAGMPSPMDRYRTAKIVGFAVRESAAALGLVAGLLVGRPTWGYALMTVTLLAMLAAFPRRSELGSQPGELPLGGGGVEPR